MGDSAISGILRTVAELNTVDLSKQDVQDLKLIKTKIDNLVEHLAKPSSIDKMCQCNERRARCRLHWKGVEL